VPVFINEEGNNTTSKQVIITDDIIFKTKEGYKAFTNCERRGGLRLCYEQDEKSTDPVSCISEILNNNEAEADERCKTTTSYTQKQCFNRPTSIGKLISPLHPIKNRNNLFAGNSSPAGVGFITKTKKQQSVICNDQIIKLKPAETKGVIVNHEIGLNFTKLSRSERMTPAMEENQRALHQKIDLNIRSLKQLAGETSKKNIQTASVLNKLQILIGRNTTAHISLVTKVLAVAIAIIFAGLQQKENRLTIK
jgi:hypothetical protein